MYNSTHILISLLVLLSTFACSTPTANHTNHNDTGPASTATTTLYTCPMHPEIRSPQPGQCPICGMTLVAMAAQPVTGPTIMSIDTVSARHAGLHSSPATLTTFTTLVRADGEVSFADSRVRSIPLRVEGWVRELGAGRPGDTLRSGQTLLILESPEMEAAQRDYIAIMAQNGADSAIARNFAQRLRTLGLSEGQIRKLEQGRAAQRLVPIVAPYGGLVIDRDIQVGQRLDAGMNILRVADLAEVWIEAQIFQDDLPKVAAGMPAVISAPGHGGNLLGTVQRILPEMHAASRTATVRIIVRNSEIALHPGAVVIVQIKNERPDTLTVPRDAVLPTGTTAQVFVDHGDGKIEPRAIEVGHASADRYEVLQGLQAGERVVDSAVFLIAAESRLRYSLPAGRDGGVHEH